MRLSDEARELLAGEYVLGTLAGAARRRFARLLAEDEDLALRVADWQVRLNGLATGVEPVAPGPWVWQRIERELGWGRPAPRSVNWWRGAAGMAAAAALVLAAALFLMKPAEHQVPVPVQVPQPVAAKDMAVLLTDEQSRSAWMISGAVHGDRLSVRTLSPRPLSKDQAYELWLLPEGRKPVSLGLLPDSGEATLKTPPELRALLEPGAALAVSVEPAGGSPTGQPTGPVPYQGKSALL